MIKHDTLIKAVDRNKQIRVFIASTRGVVEEAHRRHATSATASAALGRVLTAGLIMGADLKNENDVLSIKVEGNGPAGAIIVSADSIGNIRGYISNARADLPARSPGKLDVRGIVGSQGYLEVVKDMSMKQPFSGRVALVSGEIAEDVAHYLLLSEQVPSLVSLGVLVDVDLHIKAAGGLIIQALPGADDGILVRIEQQVTDMGAISAILDRSDSLNEVLAQVMGSIEYEVLEERSLAFLCKCSPERLVNILASFGEEELADLYAGDGHIEVTCNFCNQQYKISRVDMEVKKSEKPQA